MIRHPAQAMRAVFAMAGSGRSPVGPRVGRLAGVLLVAAGAIGAESRAASGDLPRYRLEVGQELRFEGFDGRRSNGKAVGNRTVVMAWVVDRNADGSWRIVVQLHEWRSGYRWAQTEDGTLPEHVPFDREAHDDPLEALAASQRSGAGAESISLTAFDLGDDGRIEAERLALDILGDIPDRIFPGLPRNADAASEGWEFASAKGGGPYRCGPVPEAGGPGLWVFSAQRRDRVASVFDVSTTATYRFDRDRGLVVGLEARSKAGNDPVFLGTDHWELIDTNHLDEARIARLRSEARRFHKAQKAVADLTRVVFGEAPGDASSITETVAKTLEGVKDDFTLPMFTESFARLSEEFEWLKSTCGQRADRRAALIGSTATAWKVKDLDGHWHALDDHHGQVVVLDFWYRGCVPCVKAMPQIKQVVAHFQGRPVAIFGMNIDESPDDARIIANKLALNYPTLLIDGTNLAESYGAATFGFPTLVVIDPAGTIGEIHVGSTDDLAETLIQSIEQILEER